MAGVTQIDLVVDVVDMPASTVGPIEGAAVVGVVIIPPTTWPAAPVTAPTAIGGGGAVPTPIFWDPALLFPLGGVAIGGARPTPIFWDPALLFPLGGVAIGGARPTPIFWDPSPLFPPAGVAIGGGGAVPIGPPQVPVQPPGAVGGGGAVISPIAIDPVPASPPTGGAIGTDPTIIPLPIPATPVSPPTGTGGGGGTISPVSPAGPVTTAPGGGAVGGGGATPTGPAQVPVTEPTGTGTGTVVTSPTLPPVPVTAPTGTAVGGNASTGITEPIVAPTVSAPTATVEAGVSTSPAVVDSQVFTEAPQAIVTGTSNGTTITASPCPSCCGGACTTDIHGPNGCEAVVNRYCVRLYNFRGFGMCLPSEFTFEVTHSDRADLPGGTTCNVFVYTPDTFAPTSTAGCTGKTYAIGLGSSFAIVWNSLVSKFRLSMPYTVRIRYTDQNGNFDDWRIYNPGYASVNTTIACNPFKMTWQNCSISPFVAPSNFSYLLDMDLEYCAPAQMANPTTTPAQALIQQSKTRLALPCIHRGEALEASASCGCGGAVLTECAVYGQCRPYGTATDAQVCTRCPDYAAP